MTYIYLDNNASTQVAPEVVAAMEQYACGEIFGNPHSGHFLGGVSRAAIEEARDRVKAVFNVSDVWKCVFTSGASESNNMAIKGIVFKASREKKTGIRSTF